jgi:ribonucleotide monophosphatase NagD (HAD superfamily)
VLRAHFGEAVRDDQVVLASSPLQHVSSLREARILLVAHRVDEANTVAAKYGWEDVVHFEDFYREHTYLWPLEDVHKGEVPESPSPSCASECSAAGRSAASPAAAARTFPTSTSARKIDAVVIIHCPATGWGKAIQVVSDVLQSDGTLGSWVDKQCIPLYVTNYDLVYTSEYPKPRFTTGVGLRGGSEVYWCGCART